MSSPHGRRRSSGLDEVQQRKRPFLRLLHPRGASVCARRLQRHLSAPLELIRASGSGGARRRQGTRVRSDGAALEPRSGASRHCCKYLRPGSGSRLTLLES